MRIRNQILLWLMLVGLLPLLLLLVASIIYGERFYQGRVDRELTTELNRISSLLDDQLQQRNSVLESIVGSPVLEQFASSLAEVLERQVLTQAFSRDKDELENYLLDLQPLIPGDAVIRIVDQAGWTLIKIRFGRAAELSLESLPPYRVLDQDPDDMLAVQLAFLPLDSVSHMRFPGSSLDFSPQTRLALLDAILPVQTEKHRIYIVYSTQGLQLDHALDLAPRLRESELLILESRPEYPLRLLTDDAIGQQFTTDNPVTELSAAQEELIAGAEDRPEGVIISKSDGNRYVFTEYHPYPDRLLNWIIAARISPTQLTADLQLLRKGLIGLALFSLLLSLLLSGLVARYLSQPICRLANNIQAYARGEPHTPTPPGKIDEVNEVQRAFDDMAGTLRSAEQQLLQSAKMASIGEMAAGIGHELNNPLNNMSSLITLLKRNESLDQQAISDTNALRDEVKRASNIVRGILNFARQMPPQYEIFDLKTWLHDCCQRVVHRAAEKQLDIQINAVDSIHLEADPAQMEQVIVNLLNNAIDASENNAEIRLTASERDGHVIIRVEDEGTGISDEVAARLFEPFFTTKPVGEGSGLGLSISLGIIESHGGRLQLKNREPVGLTAEISLPVSKP